MASIDHTAAGSLVGAVWQVDLGLLCLLRMDLGASLGLELHDDYAIFTAPDALAVMTQAKHSFRGPSLTPASAALWTTLRVWADHAKETTNALPRFELVTTRRLDDTLGVLAPNVTRSDDQVAELAATLDEVAQRKGNKSLSRAYKSWLLIEPLLRSQILKHATLLGGHAQLSGIADSIAAELRKKGVAPPALLRARQILETWYRDLLRARLSSTGCQISHDEFLGALQEVHRLASAHVLPILHANDDVPGMIIETESQKVYQRQLSLIKASMDERLLAYEYFTRARAERSDWLATSLIAMGELKDHEADLVNRWKSLRAQAFREKSSPSKALNLSRELFDNCVNLRSAVRGQEAPHHVHVGTLHIIADGPLPPRIGWHRDYVDLLDVLWSRSTRQE